MNQAALLRMIEVVQREMGATDARVEIGGRDPEDPGTVWCNLPAGGRLVVIFDDGPRDSKGCRERLEALVEAFAGTLTDTVEAGAPLSRAGVQRALSHELQSLSSRAGAVHSWVMDASSPVIWATSDAEHSPQESVDTARDLIGLAKHAEEAGVDIVPLFGLESGTLALQLEQRGCPSARVSSLCRHISSVADRVQRSTASAWRRHFLVARATSAVRAFDEAPETSGGGHVRESDHDEGFGFLVRSFASIYRLVLVFDRPFSELHAEAAMIHVLPQIESLALSLPPLEPPPRGGHVVKLRKPRA